jgi:quinolinate synthase
MILGHHYQRDEVIQFADVTGDSFKLAQEAAANKNAEFIFFCGVHFMAESAEILTASNQKVILPDLAAGCSMADMATAAQVNAAWKYFEKIGIASKTLPITYMNSTASIKSFTGEHGGTVCTSSNAERALTWAFEKLPADGKVFFLPDQHLGRNTAVLKLGIALNKCVVWNPWRPNGGLTEDELKNASMILWKGHCSVHARFSLDNINSYREKFPDISILVHPECKHEVVSSADVVGSTEQIIKTISNASAGSHWAIGTELNLVSRLGKMFPDKKISFLDKTVCYCSTMNRIDLPHLVWAMESLINGRVVNQITVDEKTSRYALQALNQMLQLP